MTTSVEVAIRARGDSQPYFQRRFDDRETKEIRLDMWGGDDRVTVTGSAAPHITVRVVGGDGDDVFVDSSRAGRVKFYDDRGANSLEGIRHGGINTKPHPEWVGSDTNRYPPREWGTWWRPLPWLVINSDLGLFVGAGFLRTGYGFRRSPYASHIRARIGYATGANAIRADLDGEFHLENASRYWQLHVLASGIEILHYYGQGNTTDPAGGSSFHRVTRQVYSIEPALVVPIGRSLEGERRALRPVVAHRRQRRPVYLRAARHPPGRPRFRAGRRPRRPGARHPRPIRQSRCAASASWSRAAFSRRSGMSRAHSGRERPKR